MSSALSACAGVPRRAELCALKVPEELVVEIVAVRDTTIVGFLSALASWSWRTKNSMVSDLPDPCVCQITPPRCCPPHACRLNCGGQRLPHRVELVIAGELL